MYVCIYVNKNRLHCVLHRMVLSSSSASNTCLQSTMQCNSYTAKAYTTIERNTSNNVVYMQALQLQIFHSHSNKNLREKFQGQHQQNAQKLEPSKISVQLHGHHFFIVGMDLINSVHI